MTAMQLDNMGISSLEGIEYFTALKYLYCGNNNISSLDLTHNTALESLNCFSNQLNSLNVAGLTNLQTIFCSHNDLYAVDAFGLTALDSLNCSGNPHLDALNISSCPALEFLYCDDCALPGLSLAGLDKLRILHCNGNQLTTLDVSGLSSLTTLWCYDNEIADMDLSGCGNLAQLDCHGNPLASVDLADCTLMSMTLADGEPSVSDGIKKYSVQRTYGDHDFTDDILICNESTAVSFGESGASGTIGENITWTLENGLLTVTGTGAIPDYGTYAETEGGPVSYHPAPWNSYTWLVDNAVISEGITAIGSSAFTGLHMTQVSIPSTVTRIGDSAFASTHLTSVTLPAELEVLETGAFAYCPNLSSVSIPGGVKRIDHVVFDGCESLTDVSIGEGVQEIGSGAFMNTPLTAITIPDSVTTIEYFAFRRCGELTEVTIPAQVTSIGFGAFGYSGVTSIAFLGGAPEFKTNPYYPEYDLPFENVTASAYYPAGDASWTAAVRQDYGGTLTWIPYDSWPIQATAITTQPSSVTAAAGSITTFKVTAAGLNLTYQWQWKSSSGSWTDVTTAAAKTASLPVTATVARNNLQYRCVVTGTNGSATSSAATLKVKPAITTQPASVTVKAGSTATFKVTATGLNLTYQWQYKSGDTWKSCTSSGNTTATMKVSATAARNGIQYRCKVTGANGTVYSSTVKLITKPTITKQPSSVTTTVGSTATFKVTAAGVNLKYQWQWNDNGTWKNCGSTGNKTATLKVPATAGRYGYKYRCKVTGANGTVYSSAATLRVYVGATGNGFVNPQEAYTQLNAFRAQNGVWVWNSDDSTKTYYNTNSSNQLSALKRSAALQTTAETRAKEIATYFSHYRPDGTICFTAYPDYYYAGENIAAGYTTGAAVINAWKENDGDYYYQGHRRNMLDPDFDYVGIACYRYDGVCYWVMSLASF